MDAGSGVCGGFRVDQRRRVRLDNVARELKVLLAHLRSLYFFVTIFAKLIENPLQTSCRATEQII